MTQMKTMALNNVFVLMVALAQSIQALPGIQPSDSQQLKLTIGQSIISDFPSDVARVSTNNSDIVDAVAVSSREILFNAKAFGSATLVVWLKSGERVVMSAEVDPNLEPVRRLLKETFPNESIDLRAARDSLSLIGRVSAQPVADRAVALVTPLAKSVISNLQVLPGGAEKQIVLRVTFAELNRNVSSSFGLNLLSTGALNTPGRITTGQFSSANPSELTGRIGGSVTGTKSTFTLSDALNVFAFRPDLNLAAAIKALQNQGLLQILAEPNLVTTDGKEASFLVGGEFPVPIVQGGSNAGAITVQFREFGIRLTFLPQSTPHNTIKLHVKPEVSAIDLANAVVFSGFTIPAISTRRMETNIELGEGQSFVIAGLLDDRVTENLSKIPGLANIPLLGFLFKSKTESRAKTELVVIVTPEVTYPLSPGDPKPLPVMPRDFLPPIAPKAQSTGQSFAPGTIPAEAFTAPDARYYQEQAERRERDDRSRQLVEHATKPAVSN